MRLLWLDALLKKGIFYGISHMRWDLNNCDEKELRG